MIAEQEVRVGTKVRVLECWRDPHLRGLVGEVTRVHRVVDHTTVLDVRLEDEYSSLFWIHELEESGERGSPWWQSLFSVGRR